MDYPSLADIAAVTDGTRNDGMFGGGSILLVLVLFFTWLMGKLERRLRNSER